MTSIKDKMLQAPHFRSLKGAPDEQIAQAQADLNLQFSTEYREYVSAFGAASFAGHELTGVCPSKRLSVIEVTKEERINNPGIPTDWYVVEQANIDGVVIWQDSKGAIYQSLPGAKSEQIANSLLGYLKL